MRLGGELGDVHLSEACALAGFESFFQYDAEMCFGVGTRTS